MDTFEKEDSTRENNRQTQDNKSVTDAASGHNAFNVPSNFAQCVIHLITRGNWKRTDFCPLSVPVSPCVIATQALHVIQLVMRVPELETLNLQLLLLGGSSKSNTTNNWLSSI